MGSGLLGKVCGGKAEDKRTAYSNLLNVIIMFVKSSVRASQPVEYIRATWHSSFDSPWLQCQLLGLLWGSRWWCDPLWPSSSSQCLCLILVLSWAGQGADGGGHAGVTAGDSLFSEHRTEVLLSWMEAGPPQSRTLIPSPQASQWKLNTANVF